MIRKTLLALVVWAFLPTLLFAQAPTKLCISTGANNCVPITSTFPLPVTPIASGTPQDINIKQIQGAVPSLTNPLWIIPATGAVFNSNTQYPSGAVPFTASTTGTTAATTATLTGAASVTTFICGFSIRANATAAITGNATVTGTISGTLNFTQWTAPLASGLGISEMIFSPCVPASSVNTSIAVISAAPGAGGVVSVTAWGYKL